ncbi:MAG TPA: type III-B CRISPR module RAMP protein Cmr1, partial [Aggregatilineales bacterium]|nr:type III-B CRISPR module RAMP protein Cmr1 [Aggregatilineales bacterium]
MASENHPLGITSPLFLYGAYQQEPELRAASVRGQLRYWFRAIEGAKDANLETLRERERNVFGSTERGSQVSIRLYEMNRLETVETSMLPHRSNGKSLAKAFKQGQTFDLQVVTRPGVKIPNAFQRALYTWFLLGGLGKRSRRMFGAFNVNNRDNVNNR